MTRDQFKAKYSGGHYGDNGSMKNRLTELAGKVFDGVNPLFTLLTDNATLTEDQTGGTFAIATDAKVITLPATKAGLLYRIINFGATTNNIVSIDPADADGISGTITLAATVVVDAGVVGKKLLNTKATSQCGDSVTLYGTGVTGTKAWIILNSTGIWAAEA